MNINEHKARFPSETQELKGRFVGFSKHVGHALTYKILTDGTRKILHRSVVRRADTQRNLKLEPAHPSPDDLPAPSLADFPHTLRSQFDDALREGRELPTIPDLTNLGETNDISAPDEEVKTDEDLRIGQEMLMPTTKDGQRFRAKIIEILEDHEAKTNHKRSQNQQYRVLVGHDGGSQWEDIVAYNDLAYFLCDEGGDDGTWKFREIQSHQGPLTPDDERYKGSRWNVLIHWETGEITWEPLRNVQHQKVMCGLYASQHNLLDEPGWIQFRKHAKRSKKLLRMANQARLQSFRTAPKYMFGVQIP